jgi:hypothetical protein
MTSSFGWGVRCEFVVPRYRRAMVSAPELSHGVSEKDLLLAAEAPTQGKWTLSEHVRFLRDRAALPDDRPLLAVGLRNSVVNLRAPMILDGRTYAVDGERPEDSRRPYYGLGLREGRLTIGRAFADAEDTWSEAFVAGVPVLWDDLSDEALFELILAEAADHSHVFAVPRGLHPRATEATRAAWSELHAAFTTHVHAELPDVVAAMRTAVAALDRAPSRCDNYLNGVIGVRDDGAVVCVYAHGRLEELGRIARALGCRRAICVENSGSVMPTYLPAGLSGEQIPLLRAPNFRPRGRALLCLELETQEFESFQVVSA